MRSREKENKLVEEYYKKQEQIDRHKYLLQKQHDDSLKKQHQMEMMKEEIFNNIRKSKDELEKTKIEQVLKKNEQVETKVVKLI